MLHHFIKAGVFNQLSKYPLPLKALRFFVFSNIFITICALIMSLYTSVFFSAAISSKLILFTAAGTLCSYSLHWLLPSTHTQLSPREKWSASHRLFLTVLFLAGAAVSVYSVTLLTGHIWELLPLIILTFLYSSGKLPRGPFVLFRKYFIGKTIYLALMWSMVTVYLPVVISNSGWNGSHTIFLVNRFFFLFAICILFDLRDKELDTQQGIKSLITILSHGRIKNLFFFSLLLSLLAGISLIFFSFPAQEITILNFPVLIAAAIYKFSSRTRSELWFYFVLDGLMMLSGAAAIIYAVILG
ncbi:MAG TPA: hypothetical protein PKE39_00940 [Ignavibacteria bacterium]|nr:hypothetical protein [Ignavibacteria bacterium]HMQ97561.1 hypothetical protein [Ignavibacteria bacterium]